MPLTIPFANAPGEFALIDEADGAKVKPNTWRKSTSKRCRTVYAYTTIRGPNGRERVLLHRLILGLVKGDPRLGDHLNHNGLDCTRQNLRIVDASQNQVNTPVRRSSKTGYTGVAWARREQKWRAFISWRNRSYHLGYYAEKQHAALAYNTAAAKLHGAYACPNPIDTTNSPEIASTIARKVETHLRGGFRKKRIQ
jgi:hypothetical protein